ncbi:MAG: ring-cleaving dioxygenase [Spirochaetaceae bacterium]
MEQVRGMHHVTAISGDPQETVDFYIGVLGLRLVKRSVNQDVPDTYHLFFADGEGHPGTDITFFPWPSMGPKRDGVALWQEIYLAIPQGTVGWWEKRLADSPATPAPVEERFGEKVLPFTDPHGMRLALVEAERYPDLEFTPWSASPVGEEYQIRCLAGARLLERNAAATERFLSEAFGFQRGESEEGWTRYTVGEGLAGQRIDLREVPDGRRGQWGVGAVHHVAWRVPGDREQGEVQRQVMAAGRPPTEVIDRFWFRSVYVMEPGGALCEIATDGPGFSVDEDSESLGESLVLPPFLEEQRRAIESALVEITVPAGAGK